MRKLKCIDNKDVEHFLTLGKIYEEQIYSYDYFLTERLFRVCGGWFLKSRFEIIEED
ncbi:MAG: hypothetical protein ACRDDY_03410 [Clostridium sp.]|uniref:hypothetical protein n=1 Tax=Clostridium sp. TaxID=1506 RepID=UPI003EE42652